MKEQQAIEILCDILLGAQRARSIIRETFGELPDLSPACAGHLSAKAQAGADRQELVGQTLQALYDADQMGEYLHFSDEALADLSATGRDASLHLR